MRLPHSSAWPRPSIHIERKTKRRKETRFQKRRENKMPRVTRFPQGHGCQGVRLATRTSSLAPLQRTAARRPRTRLSLKSCLPDTRDDAGPPVAEKQNRAGGIRPLFPSSPHRNATGNGPLEVLPYRTGRAVTQRSVMASPHRARTPGSH